MYKQFKTDNNLEASGIDLDYGDFVVTVARAGGTNRKFAKVMESKTKPYRRLIQTETMSDDIGENILREVYASAVVLDWKTKVDGEFKQGIEGPDGDLLPFTKENIIATFKNLPDLFTDIREQSAKIALFRSAGLEEEAGN